MNSGGEVKMGVPKRGISGHIKAYQKKVFELQEYIIKIETFTNLMLIGTYVSCDRKSRSNTSNWVLTRPYTSN